MSISLRKYQIESLNQILDEFNSINSVLLQMPTGTGKTAVFCALIKKWIQQIQPNKRVLVLVHRKELVDQIIDRLLQFGIIAARIQTGHSTDLIRQVQVGLIQSIARNENRYPINLSLIIIDEAHHTPADSYLKILNHYRKNKPKILGVTATPSRLNGNGFDEIFDKLITSYSIVDFIKKGYLSPIKHLATSTPNISKVKIDYRKNDFDEKELEVIMRSEQIMAEIIESYLKYGENKKTIVFALNKAHSMDIVERFNNVGIKAQYIDSSTKKEDRDKLVKQFKNNEFQILCNVNIFTEGFDCPDIEVVQLARPTKSLALYLQQVGRVMRPFPGKKYGIILDNAMLWETHGLISKNFKWNLEKGCINNYENDLSSSKNDSCEEVSFTPYEMLGLNMVQVDEIINYDPELSFINDLVYVDWFNIKDDDNSTIYNLLGGIESGYCEYNDYIDDYYGDESLIKNNLKIVKNNSQFGIYDSDENKLVLDYQFDSIDMPDIIGKSFVSKNNKVGLFDCFEKEIALNPKYDFIEKTFSFKNNNINVVGINNKVGIVMANDQILLDFIYDEIILEPDLCPEIINCRINNYWYLFDYNFKEIKIEKCDKTFTNNTVLISYKNFWGIIDENLEHITKPLIYPIIEKFEKNFLIKHLKGLFSITDNNLNSINNLLMYSIKEINENLFLIQTNSGKGVINNNGEIIITPLYESIEIIDENYSYARNKNLWKLLHKNVEIFESIKKITIVQELERIKKDRVLKNTTKKKALNKVNDLSKIKELEIKSSIITSKITERDRQRFIRKEIEKINLTIDKNSIKVKNILSCNSIKLDYVNRLFETAKLNLSVNENLIISNDLAKFIEYMIEYDKINSFH